MDIERMFAFHTIFISRPGKLQNYGGG